MIRARYVDLGIIQIEVITEHMRDDEITTQDNTEMGRDPGESLGGHQWLVRMAWMKKDSKCAIFTFVSPGTDT